MGTHTRYRGVYLNNVFQKPTSAKSVEKEFQEKDVSSVLGIIELITKMTGLSEASSLLFVWSLIGCILLSFMGCLLVF